MREDHGIEKATKQKETTLNFSHLNKSSGVIRKHMQLYQNLWAQKLSSFPINWAKIC